MSMNTGKERKIFQEAYEAMDRLKAAYEAGANDEAEKIEAEIEALILRYAEEIKIKHSLMPSLKDIIVNDPDEDDGGDPDDGEEPDYYICMSCGNIQIAEWDSCNRCSGPMTGQYLQITTP